MKFIVSRETIMFKTLASLYFVGKVGLRVAKTLGPRDAPWPVILGISSAAAGVTGSYVHGLLDKDTVKITGDVETHKQSTTADDFILSVKV